MKMVLSKMFPQNFNDFLALLSLPFVLVWVAIAVALFKWVGVTVIEAFGLGTGTGIVLAILKDVFQFYFRKAKGE